MAGFKKLEEQYMRRALSLAVRGMGNTSPNPMVGCVIVAGDSDRDDNGEIIGEGWHHKCGEPHAEVEALSDALTRGNGDKIRGATVYVTLEPCCHQGRTPPCAQRLVKEGVARVVVAVTDPNPRVSGGGLAVLRDAGVETVVLDENHELAREARWINRGFLRVHTLGRPWVMLKAAISLDGRMALTNGDSKWITGQTARTLAHKFRSEHDAVLVGVGTVLADNPELTVRHVDGRSPRRIILDSNLRTPPNAKVVTGEGGCIIFTSILIDSAGTRNTERAARVARLRDAGAKIIFVPASPSSSNRATNVGRPVDLGSTLSALANEGILNVMVEGGPRILTSFMRPVSHRNNHDNLSVSLADELALFVAPRILGEGVGLGTGLTLDSVANSINLRDVKVTQVAPVGTGDLGDLLLRGRFACSPDL